jgi:hypothetical protein
VAEFGDFAMMRKMLLGIKSRAEAGPADGKLTVTITAARTGNSVRSGNERVLVFRAATRGGAVCGRCLGG